MDVTFGSRFCQVRAPPAGTIHYRTGSTWVHLVLGWRTRRTLARIAPLTATRRRPARAAALAAGGHSSWIYLVVAAAGTLDTLRSHSATTWDLLRLPGRIVHDLLCWRARNARWQRRRAARAGGGAAAALVRITLVLPLCQRAARRSKYARWRCRAARWSSRLHARVDVQYLVYCPASPVLPAWDVPSLARALPSVIPFNGCALFARRRAASLQTTDIAWFGPLVGQASG